MKGTPYHSIITPNQSHFWDRNLFRIIQPIGHGEIGQLSVSSVGVCGTSTFRKPLACGLHITFKMMS